MPIDPSSKSLPEATNQNLIFFDLPDYLATHVTFSTFS
jgi:hypothetical protein